MGIKCLCTANAPCVKKHFPFDRPLSCNFCILKELAQKIKGYQEQIASLNSKCKMLAVKAKHATMLLTVSDVEGVPEGLQELDVETSKKYAAKAVMVRENC